jgi:hypothetical protein
MACFRYHGDTRKWGGVRGFYGSGVPASVATTFGIHLLELGPLHDGIGTLGSHTDL